MRYDYNEPYSLPSTKSFLTVNNFFNDKWYSLAALYKDDIAVYNCNHSFLNFLKCISQSSRIKQTWKISFLEKTRNGKLIICNEKLIIMYLSISK